MDLSIIIINWNSVEYLRKCLSSVYSQNMSINYEIIVVDNASYDGSFEMVSNEFPSVKFIQSKENIGFGRANNIGATYVEGDVLLFLNPDTEIQSGAISHLYSQLLTLLNPGVVGCRLINSNGSLQKSCVQSLPTIINQVLDAEILRRLFPRSRLWGIAAFYDGNPVTEVEALSGACMMIRREVFHTIGGFSPDYFMYGEDLDLCFKSRKAGYLNYYVDKAIVVHHGGGSSKKAPSGLSIVRMRKSVKLLLRKSHGAFYSECYRSA
jgi:hypothetical protein